MNTKLLLAAVSLAALAPIATAEGPKDLTSAHAAAQSSGDLSLSVGRSVPLTTKGQFNKIAVADDALIEVTPVTDTQFLVRGKGVGRTNILVYRDAQLVQMIDVQVTQDIDAIREDLKALFPSHTFALRRVASKIYVEGVVADSRTAERVMAVVESYAPDGVINALTQASPQQVALKVRFLEASRETVKQLGFGSLLERAGDFSFLTSPAIISGEAPNTVGTLFGSSGSVTLDVMLRALEEKGIVRTLAEPNLVTSSGSIASFLAGGEFPIPVAAEDGKVTIEFRDFGVSLDFEPEVTAEDRVNLHVKPEVSQVDPRNGIRVSGFEIPALTVRRADTEVELRHGQTFAIAGLLQNAYDNDVLQTPFLGDVPVLGSLFRSTRFQERETELIILVTPMLMNTAEQGSHADPMPNLVADHPSEGELFLLGRVTGTLPDVGG